LSQEIISLPARPGKSINDQPDLDLLYFEPYVSTYLAKDMFEFLRSELPFYRVEYSIKRGGVETHIRTPRLVICSSSIYAGLPEAGGQLYLDWMKHHDSTTRASL
jgi:hypothetical protein